MKIEIQHISTGGRLRALNKSKIQPLAESIKEIGLLNPIHVYTPDDGETIHLVAGLHRLEACKKLGYSEIEVAFISGTELDSQLAEIDENLCRAELTPTEISEHLAKRKEVWEERQKLTLDQETGGTTCPTSLSDGRSAGPQHEEGFATNTAKATGKSKRDINRSVKRGNEVCKEARDLIRGTKLDKGTYLDLLTDMKPKEQVKKIKADIKIIEDKEKERELRKRANKLKNEAKEECLRFLSSQIKADKWGYLIDVIDRAGGTIKSSDLQSWGA